MEEILATLDSHYGKIVEGDRLFSSKANSVEFFTTCRFIENYLQPNSRIIELGAGHGTYSLHFSLKGHSVLATDMVQENINAIQKLIEREKTGDLHCRLLDATDMSSLDDNQFDLTLCLGPIYHLRDRESRKRCYKESIRITEEGGVVAFAYINRVFGIAYMQSMGVLFGKDDYQAVQNENWNSHTFPDDFMNISHFAYPEQIEEELSEYNLSILSHIAADGPYTMFKDNMEKMSDEEFSELLSFHYHMAAIPSSRGASGHNLVICRKK
ncbi:MAG: class I SAM-dependent methyltransferase [Spirochaetales bacterium]|nr:class I SAM-dependent methyltransferase [Spirochaetales bacterium]